MKIPLRLIERELICSLFNMSFGIFQYVLCYYKAGHDIDRAMLFAGRTVLLKVLNRAYLLNEISLVTEHNFCFCQENGCCSARITQFCQNLYISKYSSHIHSYVGLLTFMGLVD